MGSGGVHNSLGRFESMISIWRKTGNVRANRVNSTRSFGVVLLAFLARLRAASAWVDIDVSTRVPAGATGVRKKPRLRSLAAAPLLGLLALLLVSVALPSAARAQIVFEKRIGVSSDDAEEASGGAVDITSSDLELTDDSLTVGIQTIGLRFPGVVVPSGATITDAYVQFTHDGEVWTDATNLTLYGELVAGDNPGTFTTATSNISDRFAVKTTGVAWNSVPEWTPANLVW